MKRGILLIGAVLIIGLLGLQFLNWGPIFLEKYGVDKKQNLIIYRSGSVYYVWSYDDECMFEINLKQGKYYLYSKPHFDPMFGWIFFGNFHGNGAIDMSTGLRYDREVPVIENNQVTVVDPHQRGEKRRITFTLKEEDVPKDSVK